MPVSQEHLENKLRIALEPEHLVNLICKKKNPIATLFFFLLRKLKTSQMAVDISIMF